MPLLSNTNLFPVFRSISLAFTTAAIRINLWWNAQYVPETVPGDWHTILLILRATLHFPDAGSEMLNDLPEVALSVRSRIEAHPGQSGSRSCALIAVPQGVSWLTYSGCLLSNSCLLMYHFILESQKGAHYYPSSACSL